MLDILKKRLPEGLEIAKVEDRARASNMKIWFSYEGTQVMGYLPKTCTPGCAEEVCDMTICGVVMKVGFECNDLEKEKNSGVIDIPFEPVKVPVGFGGQVEYECGGGGVEVWAKIKRSPVSEMN